MKYALGLALGLLLVGACASSPDNPSTGGGGTSTTSSGPTCGATLSGECGDCMKGACCDTLTACEADADCVACVTGSDPDACEKTTATHDRALAYLTCKGGPCQAACIGGTVGSCEGVLSGVVKPACQTCMEGGCCAEVAACKAHEGCWVTCFTEQDEAACHAAADAHAVYHAMLACLSASCSEPCIGPTLTPACDAPAAAPSGGTCAVLGGSIACNPVTNEGCPTNGSACDAASGGGFSCYPPENTNALCAACSDTAGWCAPGMTCNGGKCLRYCCADGDCGTGHCDKTSLGLGEVGVCVM